MISGYQGGHYPSRHRVNHAALNLITPPTSEPIATDEMMTYARVTSPSDIPTIERLVSAARERLESFLCRGLMTQTWDLTLDWGPAWIELPWPPLQSIVGVWTRGLDYTEALVDPATYYVNAPARMIGLLPSKVWPPAVVPFGFRVRFIVGYGDDRSSVPNGIVTSLQNMVVYAFDNRETIDEVPQIDQANLISYQIKGAPWRMARGQEVPYFDA